MDNWKDGKRNGDVEEASGDLIEVLNPDGKWPGGRFALPEEVIAPW